MEKAAVLPVCVINLEGHYERRRNAERQMQRLGVEFEFFGGYCGDEGRALFDGIDTHGFLLNTGKRPRSGEIGCYASHKALWKRCLASGRPLVIMEDDFCLDDRFKAALDAVDALIHDVEYVRLQHERRAHSTPVLVFGEFQLERYTKLPHCAMCYALTPRVAERLLSLSHTFRAPVDVVMKRVWKIGQPMYCLTPYTVRDSDLCQESVIGERRRCAKRPSIRVRRCLLKIGWQLQQWRFNLLQSDRHLQRFRSNRPSNGVGPEGGGSFLLAELHDPEDAGGRRRH